MALYSEDNLEAQARDLLYNAGRLYVREWLHQGLHGVAITGNELTISVGAGIVPLDGDFNNASIYIRDNNGNLCRMEISTSTASGVLTVTDITDRATVYVVENRTLGPTLTSLGDYQIYIVSERRHFGFVHCELNYETEVESFEDDDNAVVEEDVQKASLSISGTIRTIRGSNIEAIWGGSEITDSASYGVVYGSTPNRSLWEVNIEIIDKRLRTYEINLYKGRFQPNGAISISPRGYKMIPFMFKSFANHLQRNTAWNMMSIRRLGGAEVG